ncbi:alpha/beta hydrolase family protein [Actinoplanes sp. NPDC051494]|uniref:alpha/beta hydrolase family protein n=1 Tax=Actinoplanes sp. NPDC051494 TaxID=3363907 RepID=UPI0037AE874D
MRRVLVSAALAAALVTGAAGHAWAAPPPQQPPGESGRWSVAGGTLTWRSERPVPIGDAAVEFWAGGKPLGRPHIGADSRTLTLDLSGADNLDDLSVRAGGRRLDQDPPAARRGAAAVAGVPAQQPANAVDPGVKGRYRTVTGEYALNDVKLPEFPAGIEMRAVVVAPKGAPGKRPLALFLHGRHSVCFAGQDDGPFEWPCPAGYAPIPSYRGYLQAQQLLASQGYVTVSISANGISAQDNAVEDAGAQARSSLVRRHLALWAGWSGADRTRAPAIVRAAPRADLSRVFLMGHSRGGEGVSRAALDSLTPPAAATDGYRGKVRWTIRGLLLIGPTIFGQNPVPDVPSATILPGCDGDVSDLQGQIFVDGTRGVSKGRALHSSLYVIGANHNYFNSEWTPGQAAAPAWDDFWSDEESPDPVCDPGTATRLTAAQEQTAGATYIAAAARLFVGGDDRVRPLLDGSGVRARSADPARVLSHALGGRRTPVLAPDPTVAVSAGARICEQIGVDAATSCLDPENFTSGSPHFASFGIYPEPGRYAADVTWSAPGRPVTFTPARAAGVTGSRNLELRLAVPPNSTGTRFGVAVVGPDGRRTALGDVRLDGLPGTERTTSWWAQEVRVPLKGVRTVAKLELTPRTATGRALLIDAWGWTAGTPDPALTSLPRIDVGTIQVPEGDTGTKSYEVPVRVSRPGTGRVRVFLLDTSTYASTSFVATVRPGDRVIKVPAEVTGDTLWGEGERALVLAKAEKGFVVGDYVGGLDVRDDDPRPVITVQPATSRVAEGETLRWEFALSAPAESYIWAAAYPRVPASGAELSSTDVDADWFRSYSGEYPEPSRPLSQTQATLYLDFPPGETASEITVPTVADDVTEPEERIEASFQDTDFAIDPLIGIVH